MDVLTVERGDEGAVQSLENRPGDLIALALALVDPIVPTRCRVSDDVSEAAGALGGVGGGLIEEGEELVIRRQEPEAHVGRVTPPFAASSPEVHPGTVSLGLAAVRTSAGAPRGRATRW